MLGRAARLGGANRARAGQSAARPNRAEPERLGWTTEQAEPSMHATEPNRAEGLNLLGLLSLLGLARSCSEFWCNTQNLMISTVQMSWCVTNELALKVITVVDTKVL